MRWVERKQLVESRIICRPKTVTKTGQVISPFLQRAFKAVVLRWKGATTQKKPVYRAWELLSSINIHLIRCMDSMISRAPLQPLQFCDYSKYSSHQPNHIQMQHAAISNKYLVEQ